jgi:hypothetical protein
VFTRARVQTLFASSEVTQVNIPAESGMMGVLAGHVPTIESLKPGVVEVIEGSGNQGKKWFSKYTSRQSSRSVAKVARSQSRERKGRARPSRLRGHGP